MTAPATAERTRAAAGATPANLKEAAPFELKVEGVAEAAVPVPDADEADETGVVAVAEREEMVREADDLKRQSIQQSLVSTQ